MTAPRASNGHTQLEVSRSVENQGAYFHDVVSFSDARWEVDDEGRLWIIGQDGPVGTFNHGHWMSVREAQGASATA